MDTTCGHKAKDITLSIARRRGTERGSDGQSFLKGHWNRFKGNVGAISEGCGGARGLSWALVNSLLPGLICCIIIRWNDVWKTGLLPSASRSLQGHRVQIFTKTSLACIFWHITGWSTCGLSFLHSSQTWCDWVITRQINVWRVHITQHSQVPGVWILTKCPWHTFWTAEPFTANMVCWYISSEGWAAERLGCYPQLGQCHRFESVVLSRVYYRQNRMWGVRFAAYDVHVKGFESAQEQLPTTQQMNCWTFWH